MINPGLSLCAGADLSPWEGRARGPSWTESWGGCPPCAADMSASLPGMCVPPAPAVLFGLAILIGAACCLLCWRVPRPGAAKLLTTLLWLDTALLMLLGAGALAAVPRAVVPQAAAVQLGPGSGAPLSRVAKTSGGQAQPPLVTESTSRCWLIIIRPSRTTRTRPPLLCTASSLDCPPAPQA